MFKSFNFSRLRSCSIKNNIKSNGFTLIEILIVVGIVGILATIVLSSISSSRAKSRDSNRVAALKQTRIALELYKNDNGFYPKRGSASTSLSVCPGIPTSHGNASWCGLVADLAPYKATMPGDPLGPQNTYLFYYDADSGDGYNTFGMMARMESSSNYNLAINDGGYYNSSGSYYEVGQQPKYCKGKYAGTSGNWWGGANLVCNGGN